MTLNCNDNYEILLIQDGGEENSGIRNRVIECDLGSSIKVFYYPISLGISGAVVFGASNAMFSHVCIVPGNNQFTSDSYSSVCRIDQHVDAVLGYRTNMFSIRPIPKMIISKIATVAVKIFFFPYFNGIRDFNGLNVWKASLIKDHLAGNEKHGLNLALLTPALFHNGLITQIQVVLRKSETYWQTRFKFPKLKDSLSFLKCLLKLFLRYRLYQKRFL